MSPEIYPTTTKWNTWRDMHKQLGCYDCKTAAKGRVGLDRCCFRQKDPVDIHIDGQTGACIDSTSYGKECDHSNIDWCDGESDFTKVVDGGLSSDFVTHYKKCPDCGKAIEGETEGGV